MDNHLTNPLKGKWRTFNETKKCCKAKIHTEISLVKKVSKLSLLY